MFSFELEIELLSIIQINFVLEVVELVTVITEIGTLN